MGYYSTYTYQSSMVQRELKLTLKQAYLNFVLTCWPHLTWYSKGQNSSANLEKYICNCIFNWSLFCFFQVSVSFCIPKKEETTQFRLMNLIKWYYNQYNYICCRQHTCSRVFHFSVRSCCKFCFINKSYWLIWSDKEDTLVLWSAWLMALEIHVLTWYRHNIMAGLTR